MALWLSAGLLAMFVANVTLGATSAAAFLGDVGEMLLLAAAAVAFVAAILKREAERAARPNGQSGQNDQ